jgi:3-oxoadipate enol-lactonase
MPERLIVLFVALCAATQAQPATAEVPLSPGRYASVNGSKIYYEEYGGPGINLVLLHDGLLHSITWDEVWKPLCSKYHVIRYDRRGYGRSEAARAPYVPEEDLVAIMRLVKMDRANPGWEFFGGRSGAGFCSGASRHDGRAFPGRTGGPRDA